MKATRHYYLVHPVPANVSSETHSVERLVDDELVPDVDWEEKAY